jgi:flagellar biosynthesis protein
MEEERRKKSVRRAIALKYTPAHDRAPKVTAKGSGEVAEKIIRLAREHGVPIREDPALVEVLSHLDFDAEIPPSVYAVVAEILTFIYAMNDCRRPG